MEERDRRRKEEEEEEERNMVEEKEREREEVGRGDEKWLSRRGRGKKGKRLRVGQSYTKGV